MSIVRAQFENNKPETPFGRILMKRLITLIAIIVPGLASVAAGQTQPSPKPFTIDDLIKVRRVSDPQLSPNGRFIAYTIADTDKAANRRTSQIYIVSVDGG